MAAWLDDPTTKRDLTIAKRRLAQMGSDPASAWLLVLGIEILANLNIYGEPDPDAGKQPDDVDDDEDDEPWKRGLRGL